MNNEETIVFKFEIGEKALDIHDNEVEIVARAVRPEYWEHRNQYKVKRIRKIFFLREAYEWVNEVSLTKIIN